MKLKLLNICQPITALLLFSLCLACGGGESNKVIEIVNRAPSASFIATPNPVLVGESISFDSSNSSDPDAGNVLSFSWNFGDGNTSSEASPSHIFESAGSFDVILTVSDNLGLTSTPFQISIAVNEQTQNNAPSADFSVSANPTEVGDSVAFDSSASGDPDSGDTLSFNWDFDDGTSSQIEQPTHSYDTAGTYTVSLVVTDNHGLSSNPFSMDIVVENTNTNNPPTANFSASGNPVDAGETINFDSSGSFDPEGDSLTYAWNFGDGNASQLQQPSHSYDDSGTYDVSLVVTDTGGLSSSPFQIGITVTNNAPIASFSVTPNPVEINTTVTFNSDNSADPDVGDTLTYSWQFGDGDTSQERSPTHSYTTEGTFVAGLTVTDNHGLASAQVQVSVVVQDSGSNSAPTASFTVSPNPVEVNASASFNSDSSSDPDSGDTLTYAWLFGDGNSSAEQNPSHAYSSEGTYVAELVVTDNHGLSSEAVNVSVDVNAAGQYSGQPEPWPETRDLNIIWFGASTTTHTGSSSTPSYNIPRLVEQIYELSLPAGEVNNGEMDENTAGGTPLSTWLSNSAFNAIENGPSGGGSWDYVIATAIKSAEGTGPGPSLAQATESVYQALERVKDSTKADIFVNYPVPRLNGFYSVDIDSEGILTRYECIHTLGREAATDILNGPTGLAMDIVYQSLPNADLITRLKTYDNFPSDFPEDFDEDPNIFIYDVNPSIDPQHFAQPGSYFVANVFATYLYGINTIGQPLTSFTGLCASQPSNSLCAISDNMRLFLQAVAYDGVYRYRLGERPQRNGEPVDCDESDKINIGSESEDEYLQRVFGG
jgi:PKD repeat protein